MYASMTRLIENLEDSGRPAELLGWGCPVPFFGELTQSMVATVGINPSNKEFVDGAGQELGVNCQRLPTLASMELEEWAHASAYHVRHIVRACESYFRGNPYTGWFGVLERMLNVGDASFYGDTRACHLDLVPFATGEKWGVLPSHVRRSLVSAGRATMGALIRDSPLRIVVLNGRSVVREFEGFAGAELRETPVEEWTLPRRQGRGVIGVRYEGTITRIGSIDLDREVVVVGYNHNLQSSFGVTSRITTLIGEQVGKAVGEATARSSQ